MSSELEYLNKLLINNGSGPYVQNTDGLHMSTKIWLYHDYIPINPTNHRYEYDIICSIDAGNQFYVGWERYDANKTYRSNNACIYVISLKPSANTQYQRYKGVVNLSTDGVNPTAFIRLRILNAWTGSNSNSTNKAIIHSLSLKEFNTSENYITIQTYKNGQLKGDTFRESYQGASFSKNGFIDGSVLYEY